MKRTRSVPLAFILAILLVLMLVGTALAVPPRDGSKPMKDPDKPNALGVLDIRNGVAPGNLPPDGALTGIPGLRLDNILTILVEFAGTDTIDGTTYSGPLHNEITAPGPDDNTTYWLSNFSVNHYQQMLFGRAAGVKSMYNYYLEQSGGTYAVDGMVYGWVEVPHSEAYYGLDDGARVPELVRSAVETLGDSVPWADYDQNGDGIVDHIQFVHAGIDQSAGGPIWTIWAHSSTVKPAAPTSDPNIVVGPYTINPEDGTIGVFCHEFGHDLGLPDLYDTIYSGEASTGFWTLMSSGSWLGGKGEALGTTPPSLGPWEREQLGFVKPVVVSAGQPKKSVLLDPAAKAGAGTKAIKIDLPDYPWTFDLNIPYDGTHEWWSDKGDLITTTLTRNVTLPAGSELTFWSWWDIEPGYDFGYVEVSTDGGDTWATVQGNITTNDDPYQANEGNGITGPSIWFDGNVDGWVPATFDLSAYTGTVELRFRYTTDTAVAGNGWTWNNLAISASGHTVFEDTAATEDPGWMADGWQLTTGSIDKMAENYYMIEWRDPIGFDVGMNSWYNFVGGNFAEFFNAYPGMLLWYYTDEFTDNWVGVHPWQGMLQIVDAKPARIPVLGTEAYGDFYYGVFQALPAPTRINLADAAFNTGFQAGQKLTRYGMPGAVKIPTGARVSLFDDKKQWVDKFWQPYLYWEEGWWPAGYTDNWGGLPYSFNSTIVPNRGVKITAKPRGARYSGGMVIVDYSRPIPVR